jgi:phenylpropionate dioxygenase-like ring-hydroxylating dioxygenase large terminal subunit
LAQVDVDRPAGGAEVGRPTLANFWHPIAESIEVSEQPRRFYLLDTELVAFRDGEGRVSVFRDLCIHRGAALSLGWVTDGNITCPYHGWQYDRTGKCVRIPSLPEGSSIPRKARAIAYRAEERYGLVWVAMDEPAAPIPGWPSNEIDDPAYHVHISSHQVWQTSAGRACENFLDFSHFPFVHPDMLAPRDRTVIPPYAVEDTEYGLKYTYQTVEEASPSSPAGDLVTFEYHYFKPFTVHLKKITSAGDVTYVSGLACPTRKKQTDMYVVFVRNYALDTDDSVFDHFSNRVNEQDRRIVESQQPEEIPVDLREELHLKVPDASAIALRRVLATIDDVGPYMP